MEPAANNTSAPQAVLITVHGTWATNAPWAKSDSLLAREVLAWFDQRGIVGTVVPFQWSGQNSITARRAGGAALATHLSLIRRQAPSAEIYVIAHSHGGGIFSYAMKLQPQLVNEIDGFIALATPWIGLRPYAHAAVLRGMIVNLVLAAAFFVALFAVAHIAADIYF